MVNFYLKTILILNVAFLFVSVDSNQPKFQLKQEPNSVEPKLYYVPTTNSNQRGSAKSGKIILYPVVGSNQKSTWNNGRINQRPINQQQIYPKPSRRPPPSRITTQKPHRPNPWKYPFEPSVDINNGQYPPQNIQTTQPVLTPNYPQQKQRISSSRPSVWSANTRKTNAQQQTWSLGPQAIGGAPGSYTWGYKWLDELGNQMFREESSDGMGTVWGRYSFRDSYGIIRIVEYISDQYGYRTRIRSNEPGIVSSNLPGAQIIRFEDENNIPNA